jgi:hypothetical protein
MLQTPASASSPSAGANIDKRNLLWQRGLRFFVLRQHRFVHAMCILRTRKSHGVQPGNRVAQFVLASLAIHVHCQIQVRVPAQLLHFLGRQLGVVEQECDEALTHGVEVKDTAYQGHYRGRREGVITGVTP